MSYWTLIGILFLSINAFGEVVDHQAQSSAWRPAAPSFSPVFAHCMRWDDQHSKPIPFAANVALQIRPAGFFQSKALTGKLVLGGNEFTVDNALEMPHANLEEIGERAFANSMGIRSAKTGNYSHSLVRFDNQPSEQDWTLSFPSASATMKGSFQHHRIVLVSAKGQLLEAEVSLIGGKFHAVRVVATCGDGFGLAPWLDGEARLPAVADLPSSLEPIPARLHGKTALKRRDLAHQLVGLDYFLRLAMEKAKRTSPSTPFPPSHISGDLATMGSGARKPVSR